MGITLLTKEIKPKNIFYRNEVKYKVDDRAGVDSPTSPTLAGPIF